MFNFGVVVSFFIQEYYKNLDLCFCQSAQCIVQKLTPKDFGAFSHHHEEKLTSVVQTFNSGCENVYVICTVDPVHTRMTLVVKNYYWVILYNL